ncbi:MAG: RRXRR domain-containing protein [Desulfomonilaceae bacterium]
MITLGIDYGSSNIGIALVRNTAEGNEPLFAGTMLIDARKLREKSETRAAIRRLRRTRKTKKSRLRDLRAKLMALGSDPESASRVIRFCERRGYKSLFGEKEKKDNAGEEELTYRYTREEFFESLEKELSQIFPSLEMQRRVLAASERILNRYGDPRNEVRPVRIDNRGVSRCAWENCNNVTPRRVNAIDDAIRQQLVTFFQGALKEDPGHLDDVDRAVSKLHRIAKELATATKKEAKDDQKLLRKNARGILRNLRDEMATCQSDEESNPEAWKYVEEGVMNILQSPSGRNRYCREHGQEYVRYVLAGKPLPFKKSISESDIISRREQIAFSKLWRYIQARILPLAPDGVDRIVVERTAFDLLAGDRKKIRQTSDQRVEEIYQWGPMYGFKDRKEMLTKEFGGLCAYCGSPSESLVEVEHIQPRREFLFDSYLNILPACPKCNAEKGTRRVGHAALRISAEAYVKYDGYLRQVRSQRPLHFLHYEKKGILNLMRDSERAWEVDRYLSLIANNFAQIVQSQSGPRPLARFLYSKLCARQKKRPQIDFTSGRHTALYRTIAYPDFEKSKDKAEAGTVNHALDAILLASELPDPRPLEARGINVYALGTWRRRVLAQAPNAGNDGIPCLPRYDWYVEGFETVDGNGYVVTDMACMNWNQKDSATHKQDPYGWSEKNSKPTKRTSALKLYEELAKEKNPGTLKRIVETIHHPALRAAMDKGLKAETAGPAVAEAMKDWLRKSVKNSLNHSAFSGHPADVLRKSALESFANQMDAAIPPIIGVKRFDTGVQGKIDLKRHDPESGNIGHRYMTDPANKAVVLAYPRRPNGDADLSKPCTAGVRQNLALKTQGERVFGPKSDVLETGIVWGTASTSVHGWKDKLEKYIMGCGFHSYAMLTPGCVICYTDGTQRFIRNFDESKDFKKRILKNVVGVRRTPFSARVEPLKRLTRDVQKS